MLWRLLRSRALLATLSVGLILAGLSRMFDIRTSNHPRGSWQEIREIAKRDDVNLIFVLVDTLRADRLSAYGYERATSPILGELAKGGILFRNVLSQSSWTKTSMASLWTSSYPASNGITRYMHGLPDAAQSPAEILREAGLRTVGIWRNGWVAPNFGFQQGFDLYYLPKAGQRPMYMRQKNPSSLDIGGTDQDATWSAVEFLRGVGDQRFFLYIHYMDVHQYLYDQSADFGSTYSDIYDNAVHWVDANIGTLVAVLQQKDLMRRTVLVVASDHGEAFLEHGTEGHGRNLYHEVTSVPWIVALPFRLPQGIVVETPVENVDIWPTLLDLLGMPPLAGAQGRSLVPLVEAAAQGREPQDGARPRFAQIDQRWGRTNTEPRPLVSVQDGRWRLFESTGPPDAVELYDVSQDPGEQRDVAAEHPEEVARLRGKLGEYMSSPAQAWGAPLDVPLSDFQLGQLRALGYVVGPEGTLPEPLQGGERKAGARRSPRGKPGGPDPAR